jgi:hypothetical protein
MINEGLTESSINYKYKINEEIVRWSTEIYLKSNKELNWWIAFTNPTAGPWKKLNAFTSTGDYVEVYRFDREEERPDLVLVNDKLERILIVEAKDYCCRLITEQQMKKSINVIEQMSSVLMNCDNIHWKKRIKYKVVSSFLWFCENITDILKEDSQVAETFNQHNKNHISNDLLNFIITADDNDNLVNNFVYKGKIFKKLDFLID